MIEYFTAAAIPKQKMFKYLSCLGKSSAKNKNITARQLLCPTNNVCKNGLDTHTNMNTNHMGKFFHFGFI